MKRLLVLTLGMALLVCSHSTVKARCVEEAVTGINVSLDKAETSYVWTNDRVNLRTSPSLDSDIILTLDKRTKLQKKTSSEKWTKVMYGTKVGWVYSEYLIEIEPFSSQDNRWGIELTDDEIDLLAKIVWTESRSQSDTGEAAVVVVVLNRMLSMDYPDTLTEVLSEKNAFTSWNLRDRAKPTEREYEIIEEVLHDEWNVLSMDVVYFSTSPRNDNVEVKIGDHFFCRED